MEQRRQCGSARGITDRMPVYVNRFIQMGIDKRRMYNSSFDQLKVSLISYSVIIHGYGESFAFASNIYGGLFMVTERLSRHYNEKYQNEGTMTNHTIVQSKGCPVNRFDAAISFCSKSFDGGAILEIGAGDGAIATGLIGAGLSFSKYHATEVSEVRLASLRRNLTDSRFTISQYDLESEELPLANKYDMIIMVAVIEHLLDPISAMRCLRRCLNPGGFVYIDTPNIAKLSRRLKLLYGYFPSTASKNEGLDMYDGSAVDLLDEGHLHYFTYRSLTLMLLNYCGYTRVHNLGYACAPFIFPKRIQHMLAQIWPKMFSEIALMAYVD